MNVLSIGNSFSQDAQRYLHGIATADGYPLNAYNLCIGGCALPRHYRCMLSDERAYTLEVNGQSTEFKVSLKEALLTREWDVVTVQQVSGHAPRYATYQPYLDKLVEFVRVCTPKAKVVVHQTWAYEKDSHRLNVELGYATPEDMFRDIKVSYEQAARDIDADFIIPSGEVFQELLAAGIETVHRDTFHAHRGIGRYALGLTWYAALTGRSVTDNTFSAFDVDISKKEIEIAKACVEKVCKEYRK